MGFYDEVKFERAHPEHGIMPDELWQTKSFYAGGVSFTITQEGQLVEDLIRYESVPGQTLGSRVLIGQSVVSFHGDVLLSRITPDKQFYQLVARFTHGRLEWLRPLGEYPEENRKLLIEQGAR